MSAALAHMTGPTLTTERLVLRVPREADFPAYAEFFASERSVVVGGPEESPRAWRLFAATAGHWALSGYGWFTVTARGEDDTPLGVCGLHHPPYHDTLELGWILLDAGLGRGYATEAARAARDWGIAALKPERIVSYIDEGNTRSRKVAERLGATTDGTRARHDSGCEIWDHPLDGGGDV